MQNFVNSGAQGIATSVPGESMAKGLNEIIDSGVPIVQFNLLVTAVNAPYVGEKSVESGRVLGKMIVDKLGGAEAKGTVILGNCFPGFPVLENRAKGVQELLKAAPGLNVIGPFDVKVPPSTTTIAGNSSTRANPDAVALIGLCAPDVTSLGKLNAANGDKFVAGGYDLTELNLKPIKEGHAYVTIGQSAFVQGYLPVALLVERHQERQEARARLLQFGSADRDGRERRHGQRPAADLLRRGAEARRRSGGNRRRTTSPGSQTLTAEILSATPQPIAAESE